MAGQAIMPSESMDKRILDYVLTVTERSQRWWGQEITGTKLTRKDEFLEYRLRMESRRSVADLYHDAKNEPFDGASNVGVGLEAIFAEFLIPMLMANTHDLEPMLQARVRGTRKVSEDLTAFHDNFHRFEVLDKREMLEYSMRELLTVGGVFHKWSYGRFWQQAVVDFPVWVSPLDGQPMMVYDQKLGRMMPIPADEKTPKDQWPVDPMSGMPAKISSLKAAQSRLVREGPELSIREIEHIGWPEKETRLDPEAWDWLSDDFEVSPYYLLGREGDPFQGKLKLDKLWTWLGVKPDELSKDPLKLATTLKPVKLRAFHGKYPAAASGEPVEIVSLIAVDAKLNLGWLPSRFPRRPYFNRQVWNSGTSPVGKGVPETIFSMRSAMDALLNQEIDAGNLYNHPPLLLSDLAMLEDEEYETTGPGATWIMRDINGAKFLPPPTSQRDPTSLLNWLMSNTMRIWGVTDLTLNSPSDALASTPRTASGTRDILNAGSVKFGHLTKRLSSTDTKEFQYCHDCFRLMLANPKLVTVDGEPKMLEAKDREQHFSEQVQVVAVGNGISTNPILRQKALGEYAGAMTSTQNPFVIGDLEVYKQLTEQMTSAFGIDLTLKDPQALQQSKLFLDMMQTPEGQKILPLAMKATIETIQKQRAMQAEMGGGKPEPIPGGAVGGPGAGVPTGA